MTTTRLRAKPNAQAQARALLAERFSDGAIPYGALRALARELGCSTSPVYQAAHALGLYVTAPRQVSAAGWQKATAQKRARTKCKRGHPLSGYNLIVHNGRRMCRICGRDAQQRYRDRKET